MGDLGTTAVQHFMLRELESMCLGIVGALAMLLAVFNCYVTLTTNDYRPVLVQGLALWSLGSLCLWSLRRRDRLNPGFFLFIWGLSSLGFWAGFLPRVPYLLFGRHW
jgi:hypothetical protein